MKRQIGNKVGIHNFERKSNPIRNSISIVDNETTTAINDGDGVSELRKIFKSLLVLKLPNNPVFNDLLSYFHQQVSDNQFTKHDYLLLHSLFQDHDIYVVPALILYLSNCKSALFLYLRSLLQTYSERRILKQRVINMIIEKLYSQQEIDYYQKKQLFYLSHEFNSKLVEFYRQSKEQQDLQVLINGCLSLVNALPLHPPQFSLHIRQVGYDFSFLSIDVVKEVIILVFLLEKELLSNAKCFRYIVKCILCQPVAICWTGDILHSLHYSLHYPILEIQYLLYYCVEVGFLSIADYAKVIALCSHQSLALYYCFTCFLRCKSSSQFIQCCKDCLLYPTQYYQERKTLLSSKRHNKILHEMIEDSSLSLCEMVVIHHEYAEEKNNVFYEAFTVYEQQQNMEELIVVVKQLVKIFTAIR